MRFALVAAVLAAVLHGLHRLALWAERRDRISYRDRRGSSGALGNALLEVHALLEPAQRHVVEERRRDLDGEDESGEPPGEPATGPPVPGRQPVDRTKE